MRTIALELVPPNVEDGKQKAFIEAQKVLEYSREFGLEGRFEHVMIPGLIDEDDDRPVDMKPKMDILDFWSILQSELPGLRGLCTQVTSFLDEEALGARLTELRFAGIDGIIFVGVPRTMSDGDGSGVAPTDALAFYSQLVRNRGVILIPTRDSEHNRFAFKCGRGATFGMTQLLYSDAIVDFLRKFAERCEYRPEIFMSFGFVPSFESHVRLIDWLIQDPGNARVVAEQAFLANLASSSPGEKKTLMLDLYKKIIDGLYELDFPLSLHLEAPYGVSAAAFDTFAAMLDYWAPKPHNDSSTSNP